MNDQKCETCKWWNITCRHQFPTTRKVNRIQLGILDTAGWGNCSRYEGDGALIRDIEYGTVDTHAQFGCIQWEMATKWPTMTCEEFEEGYAKRSGMTVERLHELGQVAIPCACREDGCKGWAMVDKEGTVNEEADDAHYNSG